jgi:hypothetical protein
MADDDEYDVPEYDSSGGEQVDDDNPRTQEGSDADAGDRDQPGGPDPERY